jgi:hypothetical protein
LSALIRDSSSEGKPSSQMHEGSSKNDRVARVKREERDLSDV